MLKDSKFKKEKQGNYNYAHELNNTLRPNGNFKFTALDLFAGCGGLSLGFEAAGFKSVGIETDEDCCATYNKNLKGRCINKFLAVNSNFPHADIIIGGPPCQPFSVRGKQQGLKDSRDGFPIFIEAVKKIKPKIWLFENVRGLLYKNKWYLDQILAELEKLGYDIDTMVMNAADFGVPQNRERVIVVGHGGNFEFPKKHPLKITAGEALGELASQIPPESKFLTSSMDKYVAKYEKASQCTIPRDLHLDRPARTLTCRNIAAPTSDMHRIRLPDGRRRRLTVQEAARLQSFPDWFEFKGNEESVFYQIGNAVPPYFAFQIAKKAREYLESGYANSPQAPKRKITIQTKLEGYNERVP